MMSTMCAETEAQPALMGAVLERRLDEEAPAIRMTNRGLTTTLLRRGCSGRARTRGGLAAHIPRRSDAG